METGLTTINHLDGSL